MNPRWVLIRRLRGPAFLLTFAVTALLHQWDILGFGQSWPLYLIVAGVLTLAERAAMAGVPFEPYNGPYPSGYTGPYPGQPYSGPQQYGQPYQPVYQQPGAAVVPAAPAGLEPTRSNDHDTYNDPKSGGRF
jgi:hypothetical protein